MPISPNPTTKSCALALAISKDGVALFEIDKDIPLACLGEVDCGPEDWERAARALMPKVPQAKGSAQACEIWLDTSQMLQRRVRLPQGDAECMEAAASALSASTAFRAEMLAFDIGQRDAEGYTALAAIPKARLKEAEALARRLNLDPIRVTTADDTDGFAERPTFEEMPLASAGLRPVAMAAGLALALLLPALAIMGLPQMGIGPNAGNPLIAAVVSLEAGPGPAPATPIDRETDVALPLDPQEAARQLWLEIAPAEFPDRTEDLSGLPGGDGRIVPQAPALVNSGLPTLPFISPTHVRDHPPTAALPKAAGSDPGHWPVLAPIEASGAAFDQTELQLPTVAPPPKLLVQATALFAPPPPDFNGPLVFVAKPAPVLDQARIVLAHASYAPQTGPPRSALPKWAAPPGAVRLKNVGLGGSVVRSLMRPSFDSGLRVAQAGSGPTSDATAPPASRRLVRPPWRVGDAAPIPPFLPARAFDYTQFDRIVQRPAAPDVTPEPPARLTDGTASVPPPAGLVAPPRLAWHGQSLVGFEERKEAAVLRAAREAGGEGSFEFRPPPRRLAVLPDTEARGRALIMAPDAPRRVSGEPGPAALVDTFNAPPQEIGRWRLRNLLPVTADRLPWLRDPVALTADAPQDPAEAGPSGGIGDCRERSLSISISISSGRGEWH